VDIISDFELRQILSDIERAEASLYQLQQLFELGAASQQEIDDAKDRLNDLQNRAENLEQIYQNQNADRTESFERQIYGLEHQLNMLNQDRQIRILDIEALSLQERTVSRERENQIANYQSTLDDISRNSVLLAPVDGVVTSLPISQGQHINANQRLLTLGQNLVVESEIPLSNTFVTVGSTAILHNSSHRLNGVVTVISPTESAKTLTIVIESDSVTAGETFTIQFEARSSESFILVPNSAINRDSNGYFINQIRRRRGILGTEYFAERLGIYIGDSDTENTAVIRGINFFEPISIASDRAFVEGQTIRLRNESDFFEN